MTFSSLHVLCRLILIAGVLPLLFFSRPLGAATLDDAVLQALRQHPSVEGAIASLNAAKAQKREQFSNFFPDVTLTGQAGRQFADNSTSRGLVTTRGQAYSYLGEGSLTVRQRIFDGMETINRVDAAEARKDSAFNTLFDVRESLVLRAVQAYVNVLRAREAVEILGAHTRQVGEYLNLIRSMMREGAADDTEVQQARDIMVILEGIKADFQGQLMAARSEYQEAVGTMPPANMGYPAPALNLIPGTVDDAVDYALGYHPSIIAARYDARAASHDIGAEEASLYPDLNGELSYLKNDKRDEIGGETEDARAVLRLNWNFSTGGAQLARIERSKFTHQEARAQLLEIKRQIERDVRLAYSEYNTAGRQLDLLNQRRELNQKLFNAYKAQFEGAEVRILQLMQADNQLFNTKLEGINGRYRLLAAQFGVLASMGLLQKSMGFDEAFDNLKEPAAEKGSERDKTAALKSGVTQATRKIERETLAPVQKAAVHPQPQTSPSQPSIAQERQAVASRSEDTPAANVPPRVRETKVSAQELLATEATQRQQEPAKAIRPEARDDAKRTLTNTSPKAPPKQVDNAVIQTSGPEPAPVTVSELHDDGIPVLTEPVLRAPRRFNYDESP